MNKHITLLILLVLLCAMGLIVFFHAQSVPDGITGLIRQQVASFRSSSTGESGSSTPLRTPSSAAANADASSAPGVTGATGGNRDRLPDPPPPLEPSRTPVQASRDAVLPTIDPPISGRSDREGQGAVAGSSSVSAPAGNAEPVGSSTFSASADTSAASAGTSSAAGSSGASAQSAGQASGPDAGSASAAPTAGVSSASGTSATSDAPEKTPGAASQPASAPAATSSAGEDTAPQLSEADLSSTADHTLTNVAMRFSGQRMLLRIEADTPFPYKAFVLSSPERLVVDLPGNWKNMRVPMIPTNKLVNGIRLGTQKAGPRFVLDLSKSAKYEVTRPSRNVVEVSIR